MPITIEKAAELVAKMRQVDTDAAIALFEHFDDVFNFAMRDRQTGKYIKEFAELCGYPIATNIRVSEETNESGN